MASARWLGEIRQDMLVYRRMLSALVRSQMQYRVSFGVMTLTSFVATGTELLAILVLFGRFGDLAGWTVGEVALLYALTSVAFGLHEMIGAGFDVFPTTIRRGEFDRLLLRPVGIFAQVLAADFQLRRIGRIAQGLLAFALAVSWTSIAWTPAKLLYLPVAIASGTLIYLAVTVLGAVLCFWTIQSIEAINILTYGGNEMSSYPFQIYPAGLQRFFTFVVPLIFVAYIPALFLLDRSEGLGVPVWAALLPPVVGLISAGVAWLAWQFGVRAYRSTGS